MKNDGTKQTSLLESKALCVSLLLMALVFNVIFGCLRNPLGEDNTISWIGYDHPFGFIVWGTLTAAAFYVSITGAITTAESSARPLYILHLLWRQHSYLSTTGAGSM